MQNSYKKSGVNISLANKLVKHISGLTKCCQKRKNSFDNENIGAFGSMFDISNSRLRIQL